LKQPSNLDTVFAPTNDRKIGKQMLNSLLYGIWKPYLEQHLPDNCRTRLENITLMVVGMFQAGSVHLSKIGRKLPIDAQK
jgi:hypothetical protein